ncbi:MAG: UPF0104 family protein [Deltaproteobacteria bacterium]|nr:MAG: UPF0104 family protein [Deltaproteobacteria bacterium]
MWPISAFVPPSRRKRTPPPSSKSTSSTSTTRSTENVSKSPSSIESATKSVSEGSRRSNASSPRIFEKRAGASRRPERVKPPTPAKHPSPLLRNLLKISLGLLVSGVAIVLIYRQVDDVAAVWRLVKRARKNDIFYAAWLAIFIQVLRALRWHLLLAPIRAGGLHPVFAATNIGFATTNVLPLRLGEVIRPLYLCVREGLSLSATVATVVTERICDLAAILFVFGMVVVVDLFSEPSILDARFKASGFVALGVLALFVGVLCLIRVATTRVLDFVSLLTRPFPKRVQETLLGIVAAFSRGLGALRFDWAFVAIVLLSLGVWFSSVFYFHLCNRAFAEILPVALPPIAPFLLLLAISLVAAVPSSPGFIGVFHYAYQLVLVEFHAVDRETALAIALVSHGVMYIVQTTLGFGYAFYDVKTFGKIARSARDYLAGRGGGAPVS